MSSAQHLQNTGQCSLQASQRLRGTLARRLLNNHTKNLLLVSTAANTYAVDLTSHAQVWSYPAGGHLTLSAQGILFIAQSSGKLTAISMR